MVNWEIPAWPAVPELDLPPESKHSGLELAINCHHRWDKEPVTVPYRLLLSIGPRPGRERQAAWLAQKAGLAILGEAEPGF